MAKCSNCGSFCFSLAKDSTLCKRCYAEQKEREAKERWLRQNAEHEGAKAKKAKEAQDKYDNILGFYNNVTKANYHSVHELQRGIAEIDLLIPMIQTMGNSKELSLLFESDCDYFTTFALHKIFGHISMIGNRIILDPVIEKLEKQRETFGKAIVETKSFSALSASLPCVAIPLDLSPSAPIGADKLLPLKTTKITKKTPYSKTNSFVVIDIETTGLSPLDAEIIQISAIKFVNFSPVALFSTYVHPKNGLKSEAQKVNKIVEADVENAPSIDHVMPAFDQFIEKEKTIVGHNVAFDCNFLMRYGSKVILTGVLGVPARRFYDTLEMSKLLHKHLPKYNLDYMTRFMLHIYRTDAHSATSDALATGLLFKYIYKYIAE